MNLIHTPTQQALYESIYTMAKGMNSDKTADLRSRWLRCGEVGLLGVPIAKEYGGSGLDMFHTAVALEALGHGCKDNGFSFSVAAHLLACSIPLNLFANHSQKQHYLVPMTTGSYIAANAMTESESGSDAFNMHSTATSVDTGYLVQATKLFVSNAPDADVVLLYVATDRSKGFFGGISAMLLEKGEYEVGKAYDKVGLQSCSLSDVYVNHKILPIERMVNKAGSGGQLFNQSMIWERIGMAAMHVGTMQRVLECCVAYSRERKSAGNPISKLQAVAHTIADMQVVVETCRATVYRSAQLADTGKDATKHASIAKLYVSEQIQLYMQKALQLHGGYGYLSDYGVATDLRDVLAATLYSGTSAIQRNIIAGYSA